MFIHISQVNLPFLYMLVTLTTTFVFPSAEVCLSIIFASITKKRIIFKTSGALDIS